jgi:hypothetical protein
METRQGQGDETQVKRINVTVFEVAFYCIATFKHTHRADWEFYQILLQNYYIFGMSGLLKGRRVLTGRRTMQVKGIGRIE